METRPYAPTWHRSRIALVNDASHIIIPSRAQNASMWAQDAALLGLHDLRTTSTAFDRYEHLRHHHVETIVTIDTADPIPNWTPATATSTETPRKASSPR